MTREFIDDLVPLILEANENWWPRDLAVLMRVSSAWLFYGRKRLYPYPTIDTFTAARLLARSLSDNPILSSLIRGISLCPVATQRVRGDELRALRQLLGHGGLVRITLGGELAIKAERFLRLVSNGEKLEELHVDGRLVCERLNGRGSLEWDESVGFLLGNLRKLRLSEVEMEIITGSIWVSGIRELRLENVQIMGGHILDLVNGGLERLDVTTGDPDWWEEELRLVLGSCAVGSLHYETEKAGGFVVDNDAPGLQKLHLTGLGVDAGLLGVLQEKCRGLVELVVNGRGTSVTAGEWVAFIEGTCVQRLGVPWGTHGPPYCRWGREEVVKIEGACATRKIRLVATK